MKVIMMTLLLSQLVSKDCSALAVQKKHILPQTHSDVPWSCPYQQRWRTLGNRYFPSRIPYVECLSSVCVEGHYTCKPVEYSVLVARTCVSSTCNDHRIPPSMRHVMEFVSIPVNVSCICAE